MKRFLFMALVGAMACLPVFAGSFQIIRIPEKFMVAGKQMPAGEYSVSWKTDGSSVLVSLQQRGVMKPATVSGSAKQVEAQNGYSSYELDKSSGTPVLKSLVFRKFNLVFEEAAARQP